MTELAGFLGNDVVKKFQRIGYKVVRQRGSHVRMHHTNKIDHGPLTIPLHNELKVGLVVRQLIKDAGLEIDDFLRL